MSSSGSASRIPALLRSAGLSVLITLATLAVTEILLRVADFRELRQDPSERSLAYGYDSELGWVPTPGAVSTVTTARTILARHNSLGFRDIEFKPDGRPVMLFLGDSFVWGVDAEANERFTDLLRDRLPEFQTVNAGVSGYGTDQEYLWLRRIWPSVRPSVVVLLFCTDNDRQDNSSNLRYNRYHKPYFVTGPDGALAVQGQPVPKSLQLMIRENWLVRHLRLARVAALAYVEMSSPAISVPDLTERLITAIHDFVSAHDAKLLVALQSTDDRMAAHLKSERIPFVTLDGAAAYSIDYGAHFTPEGHEFVARRMLDLFGTALRGAQDQPGPAKGDAAEGSVGAVR
jgi:GDSL-like Lipase/Acylhydrolase family